jgi:hypothetical protein
LAIALVISTNQAFKNIRRKEDEDEVKPEYEEYPHQDEVEIPESYLTYVTPQVTPQVEPQIIERIVEVPVEVIKEVEKIVEVPVDRIVEVVREVPVDRVVEIERQVEVPVDRIVEVEKIIEVPFKYYVNDNGDIFDEQGSQVDERIFNKKLEELEKRILTYKK